MLNYIIYFVLCSTVSVVGGGLPCRQYTDATIPPNVNARLYGREGIACIRRDCFRSLLPQGAAAEINVETLYDTAVQSGNATDLEKNVNAIIMFIALTSFGQVLGAENI